MKNIKMSNFQYFFRIFALLACVSFIQIGTANAGGGCKKKRYKHGKHRNSHYVRERTTVWRTPIAMPTQIRRSHAVGIYGNRPHPYSLNRYNGGSYSGEFTIEAGIIGHRGYTTAGIHNGYYDGGYYDTGYMGGGTIYQSYPGSYYPDSYYPGSYYPGSYNSLDFSASVGNGSFALDAQLVRSSY